MKSTQRVRLNSREMGRAALVLIVCLLFVDRLTTSALAQSATSCGLTSWQIREPLVTVWLRDAVYDPSVGFVAVGDYGVILVSPDGENWTARYQPQSVGFTRVCRSNGSYVVMGQQFGAGSNTWSAVLWTSDDALTWTTRYTATNTVVTGLAAGNGILVAVAVMTSPGEPVTAQSLVSTDGQQWNPAGTISQRWISDITFGNGVFVAIGGSRIFASDDAAAWIEATVPTGSSLRAVGFHLGQFVAVGEAGMILTSPDGLEWTSRSSGSTASLSAVAGGAGYVAVAGNSGTVLTSQDGVSWVPRLGSLLDLRGLAYGADTFVAFGRYGAIYQSGTIAGCGAPRLSITRGPMTRVDLTGAIGARHRIEYTDRLGAGWIFLTEVASLPQSPYAVIDPTPSPTGQRFYRAIQLP